MIQGFNEQREYKERLQVETLRCLRFNTAVIMAANTKGGKIRPLKLYPLPFDKVKGEVEEISFEDRKELFDTMLPIITNGKLRGYQDKNKSLWNKDKTKIIGHIIEDGIQYIN